MFGLRAGGIAASGSGLAATTAGLAGGAASGPLAALAFGGGAGSLAAVLPLGHGIGGLGLMTKAIGATGVGSGALAGGLGGALIGSAVGTAFLGSLGLGAIAFGPVGATIGAAVAIVAGLFGRGRAKRRATAIEQPLEAAAVDLVEQYRRHQVDYENALATLDQITAQGQQSLLGSGLGSAGTRGFATLMHAITVLQRQIEDIQNIREANALRVGSMSIPEFAVGGLVPSSGGILALLHPGEFVMRRSAVDALGSDFLATLNRATRFDSGGPVGPTGAAVRHITFGDIYIQAAPGMDERTLARRVARLIKTAALNGEF